MQNSFLYQLIEKTGRSRLRLHIIFWVCVVVGYILVQPYQLEKLGWKLFSAVLFIKFSLIIIMSYLNLYVLIKYFIFKKQQIGIYVVVLLLTNFIFSQLLVSFDEFVYAINYKPGDEVRDFYDRLYFFTTQFISNFWYLGSTAALKFARSHFRQKMELNKIEIAKLQTEIKYLVAQINPHFLFNAINTIYVQVDRDNVEARETITKFSEMLRYQLYDCDVEKTPLIKEIDYLQNYIDIQRLRKSSRHSIKFLFPADVSGIHVPPLLFIGFVENAFKYVSNEKDRHNFVEIEIDVAGDTLKFIARNSKQEQLEKTTTNGIGLSNIKRRLALQFNEKHRLTINDCKEVFSVDLEIELT